ncbi:tryptophan 7-halogenase [uncultured Sphingomonas sp.]|uniref:tryptophan 7-halogenase n=1 Tax=uncultured Sphingomonas sp. TaxID=158754 RepID=UPI0025ED5428|nr:tryptophan 7-halogenase [uncultured Sphingomonas sp.]
MDAGASIGRVLVCGDGLAARMTLAALARQLPASTAIAWVRAGEQEANDLFYGNVTGPSAYAFNLSAGVDERQVMLDSATAFSWGTRYAGWGAGQAWMQSFALPFPVVDGVQFHQYLGLAGAGGIDPFVAGLQAARRGVFVHPPRAAADGTPHPLSRAEYGYQFDPADYARLFAVADRVERVTGRLAVVEVTDGRIAGVAMDDGRVVTADLYLDVSGPDARLLSAVADDAPAGRRIAIATSDLPSDDQAPLRTVRATDRGWESDTPLKGRTRRTVVGAAGDVAGAEAIVGRRRHGWIGNCVALGQAAAVIEPLTPAPMLLLERDIERLLTLIPVSAAKVVEAAEYNRRFVEDYDHAALFQQAFFVADGLPDGAYWQAARGEPVAEKLARKLTMFERRGVLVAYDLEPFHPEDWLILQMGMGRRPARHDPLAARADKAQVAAFLSNMAREIEQGVATLPPARVYRTQLEQYLRKAAS